MFSKKKGAEEKTLILGGTGKTGRRIVERLHRRDLPIRIGSRSGEPKFDWEDIATWKPALHGVDSVYITYQPDLAVPGVVDTIRSFVDVAVESGSRNLVLLSGRGEEGAHQSEQVVVNSGVDWTIVRASWFSQNFSENYLLEPILAGYVTLPAGEVGEPFVDADDIADVAVTALTEKGHAGKIYEVTGPRLLTFGEAVEEISKAVGRPIHYQQVSIEEYSSLLNEYGTPKEYVDLLTYLFTEVLDGRNAMLMDGIQQALGRNPTDFSEYVRKTAATGVWNSSEAMAS